MSFPAAYYLAGIVSILTHIMISPVTGQPTTQVYENGDSSNIEAFDRLSKRVQSMQDLLIDSLQEMKSQIHTVITSLQAVDRRLSEHAISTKNQTQNSWKLEIGVPATVDISVDFGQSPIALPIINNWIFLMQRFDQAFNFRRNWNEYRNGFGDIEGGNFWLGNEKIHSLTKRIEVVYTLRIEVYINETWFYAEYAAFSVDSESNNYTIHLKGYSGNAGDSLTGTHLLTHHRVDGMGFTTFDRDNDGYKRGNCANDHPGGWWFNYCQYGCLTCQYNSKFRWNSLKHLCSDGQGLLQAARIMIKSG